MAQYPVWVDCAHWRSAASGKRSFKGCFSAMDLGRRPACPDPYQPIDALRSCPTTGPDFSRSASTKLPFVAYGGRPGAVAGDRPFPCWLKLAQPTSGALLSRRSLPTRAWILAPTGSARAFVAQPVPEDGSEAARYGLAVPLQE